MKILIDIGHPAHVHLFRYFSRRMEEKGHRILFTCRDKEVTIQLLESFRLPFVSLGRHFRSRAGKIWGLLRFNMALLKVARRFKPDLFLSHGSIYAAQVAWLLRKPHIALEDTGNMEQVRLYRPFSDVLLVSSAFHRDLGKKMVRHGGYHELAYLHPRYFQPDPGILEILKIKKGERFVLVRFVSWQATHDVNQQGLTLELKRKMVKTLQRSFRILISSESPLPDDLAGYKINISPDRMHDVLAFADLYIGEGATMASECAVLGTPALYVNSITAGTLEDQEKHGLIYGFRSSAGVWEKLQELMDTPNLKESHQQRRQKMLAEKIDLTAFMVWFIEDYPASFKTLKEQPDYQPGFK